MLREPIGLQGEAAQHRLGEELRHGASPEPACEAVWCTATPSTWWTSRPCVSQPSTTVTSRWTDRIASSIQVARTSAAVPVVDVDIGHARPLPTACGTIAPCRPEATGTAPPAAARPGRWTRVVRPTGSMGVARLLGAPHSRRRFRVLSAVLLPGAFVAASCGAVLAGAPPGVAALMGFVLFLVLTFGTGVAALVTDLDQDR
jgi:hypothetical protein